jgi:hypothetical protein
LARDFALDLAREFKCHCWRTMYATMSSVAVIEWETHFSKHGFSHHNDNLRHGIACALNHDITLVAAGIKLDKPASPQSYIPHIHYEEPEQTDDELMAAGLAAGGLRFECPDS